jgi:integrase/recombinase XerC
MLTLNGTDFRRFPRNYGHRTTTTELLIQSPTLPELQLPSIIAATSAAAPERFVEFFTVAIRNPNTRRAYARQVRQFLAWCEGRGIADLAAIRPMQVAAYIEQQTKTAEPQTVKQGLAAIRMLFDWLVIGQIVPMNPAHSVRGPA